MTSLPLLLLIGAAALLAPVQSVVLTVTCILDADGLSVSVSQNSWGSATSVFIENHPDTLQTITSGTTAYTFAYDSFSSPLTFGTGFNIQAIEGPTFILASDISETWSCVQDTNTQFKTKAVSTDTAVDDTSLDTVVAGISIALRTNDQSGTIIDSAQPVGTPVKLVMSVDTAYQADFAIRIDAIAVKFTGEDDSTLVQLYDGTKCSKDTDIMGDPDVPASVSSITVPFLLFRLVKTTVLSSSTQDLTFRVTVQPCDTVATCSIGACGGTSPDERRKRSAGSGITNGDAQSHNFTKSALILPPGVKKPKSTNNHQNRDDVMPDEDICLGRAPVYAIAAVLVAGLIAITCCGFIFMLLKNRRREKKRLLVESTSDIMSVSSVHPPPRM